MKKILRSYPEAARIILALVFLGVIISYFIWGVGRVVEEVNRAVNVRGGGGGTVSFDLKAAGRLDLRGLAKPAP